MPPDVVDVIHDKPQRQSIIKNALMCRFHME